MTVPTVADMMQDYAAESIEFAHKRFQVALDYSPDSLARVDAMVDELSLLAPCGLVKKLFRKTPSEFEVDRICNLFGGYLGEVYRRNVGGEWAVDPELETIGVHHEDTWVYPTAKVRKRLCNGVGDGLAAYYRGLTVPAA